MSFREFLFDYYWYILVVLVVLVVGIIGYIVDSKQKTAVKDGENAASGDEKTKKDMSKKKQPKNRKKKI